MRLQEITANKLNMVRQLQGEIAYAKEHKLPLYQVECEKELIQTKHEAMNPSIILEWLNGRVLVPVQGR